MSKKTFTVVALLLLVFSVVLAACGGEAQVVEVTRVVEVVTEGEAEVVEVTRVVEVQEEVAVEVEVTRVVEVEAEDPEEATRRGGWLDTIVILQEPNSDAAIARLEAGDMQVYADDVGGEAAAQASASENLQTRVQYGLYDELMMNTTVCADETKLNPFSSMKVREAMNWAIDRNYVAAELYEGLAVPRVVPVSEASADRARFASLIRQMENKYAYNIDRANEVITAEMEAFGAELVDGKWNFNGAPVVLTFLIRNEDVRLDWGNYAATQLEAMGFTVERVERRSAELSPIWVQSDPVECQWNLYTGAWSQTAIARSVVDDIQFFYTQDAYPIPAFLAYTPDEGFRTLAQELANNDYTTLEERYDMFASALPYALEFSPRIWIASRLTLVPFRNEVSVTTDLAAGISGAALWSKTIRYADEVGGSMNIGLPSVFTEPWNPLGGSNWVFDNMVKRGIDDSGLYSDPNTGLALPGRIERAEVQVQEGFPMGVSSDWVTLSTAPEIIVPDDAWAGWDATNQVFLTAAEVYTEPQTAVVKSTVYYPADLYETVTWHDGSPISPADFVMGMILAFDVADEASPYYDEALVPGVQSFLSAFKGMKVASVDPLVIEYWTNAGQLDAENVVASWYPEYDYGSAAWHNMALMLRSEAAGTTAFTADKATANEVEQTNMIAGPSLEVLGAELATATEEGFIPYAPTLGQFVSAEDAAARYSNLAEFARRYGHYYIGTGVYFLSGVFPVEGQAVLTHNPNHPDLSSRFAGFSAAKIPVVEIDGPARVTIGEEVTFDVYTEFADAPYPTDELSGATYLLFDAAGNLVAEGAPEAVEEGVWSVTLSSDVTSQLAEGSNKLDLVVVSKLVALPGLATYEFVTAP